MGWWIALFASTVLAHGAEFLVEPRSLTHLQSLMRDPPRAGRVTRQLPHLGLLVVETSAPQTWRRDPRVAAVELARTYRPAAGGGVQSRPTDWNLAQIEAPRAWGITRGRGASVLVLDSGVDQDHPDLRKTLAGGRDFVGTDPKDYFDHEGHGTFVAGVIARVAPEVRLYAGRICDQDRCPGSAVAAGLDWAIEQSVDVVNLSIAGEELTGIERHALAKVEAAGVLVAAASGNGGVGVLAYPAAVDTVLAVGAIDRDRRVPGFSQWGPGLSLVAPGVAISSSVPRGTGRSARLAIDGRRVIARAPPGGAVGDLTGELADARDADVHDRITLVAAGLSDLGAAARAARGRGAAGVVLIDDDGRRLIGALGRDLGVPVVSVDNGAGEDLRARLALNPRPRARLWQTAADFTVMSGTSTAVPHAAAVAALIKSLRNDLTPAAVRAVLRDSARPVESTVNPRSGAGALDAAAALALARDKRSR